ncbi:MAG: biliverdin-producing heme oxygenase [Pseudomonadota bacterium]
MEGGYVMAMFMPLLRDAIMPLHDEAEKRGPLRKIPEKTMTLNEYREVLGRLYGFVSVFEKAAEPLMTNYNAEIEWQKRKRMEPLEDDLIFLGETRTALDNLPRYETVSNVRDMSHVLGVLYLFEGSRLGGLVLAKALREKFGFQDYQGYAYFSSNGAEVVPMWQDFKNFMESYVASNGGEAEIISSAKAGFDALNRWLDSF